MTTTRCTRSSPLEQGELDSYLIEITRDILGLQGRRRQAVVDLILDTAGQKGTGKWTAVAALDSAAADADRRGGLRPLPVGPQGRARRAHAAGPRAKTFAATATPSSTTCAGALRLQDRQLRPGLHADAGGGQGIRLEPQLRRHRPDVARRLHHPQRLPRQDQGGLRPNPELPTCCSTPSSRTPVAKAQAAWRAWSRGGAAGHPLPAISARWPTTTATAPRACRPTCCRPSATTSARTPTSASTSPRGEFFHTNWTGRGGPAGRTGQDCWVWRRWSSAAGISCSACAQRPVHRGLLGGILRRHRRVLMIAVSLAIAAVPEGLPRS
jgi:6-phosphogluconate dehydrogenase